MNVKPLLRNMILKREYVPSRKCDYITFRVKQFYAQEKRSKSKGYESIIQKEERIDKMLEEIYFGTGSERIDEVTLDDRQYIVEYEGSNTESNFNGFFLGFITSVITSFIFSNIDGSGNEALLIRYIIYAIIILLSFHIYTRSTKRMAKDAFWDKYTHEAERKCLLRKREQLSTTFSAHEPPISPQSCYEVSCPSDEGACHSAYPSDCEKSDLSDKAVPAQNS